jgi:hypothetical protein
MDTIGPVSTSTWPLGTPFQAALRCTDGCFVELVPDGGILESPETTVETGEEHVRLMGRSRGVKISRLGPAPVQLPGQVCR